MMWLFAVPWLIMVVVLFILIRVYWNYPEQKAIIERCELQHRYLMAGNELTGIYGDYPPADL